MPQLTTIELFKEDMKFSAGHFTIFSSTERENLHGHNYRLYSSFTLEINDNGMSVDYGHYKKIIRDLCKKLDEIVIIPGLCKHISISESDQHIKIIFNSEEMIFFKRDVIVLPIRNTTVEELSQWFINQITLDELRLSSNKVISIKVKIFSGPGQSGSANWKKRGKKINEIPQAII